MSFIFSVGTNRNVLCGTLSKGNDNIFSSATFSLRRRRIVDDLDNNNSIKRNPHLEKHFNWRQTYIIQCKLPHNILLLYKHHLGNSFDCTYAYNSCYSYVCKNIILNYTRRLCHLVFESFALYL